MKTSNNLKQDKQLILLFIISLFLSVNSLAQQRILIHSHNDYKQVVPFYEAYSQQVYSIEVDLFAENGQLLVGHDEKDLSPDMTFDDLYLNPIVKIFKQNNGRAWKESDYPLQLMIELKSPTLPSLTMVINKLKAYPQVFDPTVNPNAVRIVITGNTPAPADFQKYPDFISFDGRINEEYTPDQLKRVALISAPLTDYAIWNGKGGLKTKEKEKVAEAIETVHNLGKPIRFWATPNSITAWNTLHTMGVDIMNTDKVEACTDFFRNFEDKNYCIAENKDEDINGVIKTDRLDKTTSGFQGFNRKEIQLSKRIDIYTPTYRNDGANKPVRNIILLIGDGMGLAEINAAAIVNKGLSLLNLKHIGFSETNAKDNFTTDSAAGGSALATGESHYNRHISMSENGKVYPTIAEIAHDKGMSTGVVTWGNIADATPAVFYGHSEERDNADEITNCLLNGKLTLLNGSGIEDLTKRKDSQSFLSELKKKYRIARSIEDINQAKDKVICIDDRMDLATTQKTIGLLAQATQQAITKLTDTSNKGFFLMVEGAKIDYAGHANSVPGSVVETLGFDLAIQKALRFADSNGETLVIVTADHETGGLTLVDGNESKGLITARYMTDDHTPIMVPLFAYGPGSQYFNGVYKNTQVFHKMKALLDKYIK